MTNKSDQKRLYDKLIEQARVKHPTYPEHLTMPVKRFKINSTNGLTQAIIAWIEAHGYQAERVSNTGRPIDNTELVTNVIGITRRIGSIDWIPGTGKNGTSDVHATIPLKTSNGWDVSVKLEVKYGKDKISKDQRNYGRQVELAGGVHIYIRTLADLFEWWDENVQL